MRREGGKKRDRRRDRKRKRNNEGKRQNVDGEFREKSGE